MLHPLFHRWPVFFEDAVIPKLQISGPGNNDARVRPAGNAVCRRINARRYIGERPGGTLASRMSVVNLCENAARLALNEAVRQKTCLAHPPQAFVALRTIGGHAQEVSTLSPQDVAP